MGTRAIILWAILAASVFGQHREHDPIVIDQHKLAVIKSETPEQTDSTQSVVEWRASSPLVAYGIFGDSVVCTAPPGEYTLTQDVTTITVDWDAKKFSLSKSTHAHPLSVRGISPGPGPAPGPGPPPEEPAPGPRPVTRITYVFEKDRTVTPSPVAAALGKINVLTPAIIATEFEEDTVDGTGQVPAQYAIALAAAREAGLPALVVQSGLHVLRVVKNPKTEAEVVEAAK